MEVYEFWQRKGWSSFTAGLSQRFSGFFPSKSKFWNVDHIENWKRFDFTQKMAGKLKIFTLSHRKVLVIEIELKVLDIWTTLPREIPQKIFRLYENWYFYISDALARFRKWKFPNFGREKGGPPLQLSQRFSGFFPWKSKFWNADNIENRKRFDFTQKLARKLKKIYSKS